MTSTPYPLSRRTSAVLAGVLLPAALLAGCGVQIPADPDGTLDEVVSSRELRVGVSVNPPWTTLPATPQDDPGGSEVELVEGFARSLDVEPVWVVGGEEELVRQLEEGEVHVVVGGLTKKSPWASKVALTRPYATTNEHGTRVKHVMAAVPGENALLSELERYLDEVAP
ncbi:transporter substrate-binding domain-containing protein [Ornithinimicrobium panacihumi]|uniref:transporter substrate-binding domain-containing protein n=1 Tax=Ornithinimicrobium panacihumi TaxID=2008449 RepID=UPI003F88FE3E